MLKTLTSPRALFVDLPACRWTLALYSVHSLAGAHPAFDGEVLWQHGLRVRETGGERLSPGSQQQQHADGGGGPSLSTYRWLAPFSVLSYSGQSRPGNAAESLLVIWLLHVSASRG
jgi:hypothetical protein